jgi:hypothetical protein
MAKDKLEGKPRTVAAAKKAGSKFFFDKKGTKKLAVTAEELKKSGKTLTQWANTWKKPKTTKKAEPASAVKTSLRPKARPSAKSTRPKARPDTITRAGNGYGDMTVAEKKEVDAANAKIKADAAKRRQENLVKAKAHIASKKGTGPFKGNSPYLTYAKWSKMTDAEKKKTGLPVNMGKTKSAFEVYMNALNKDR